ncbi:hypothetical protein Amet_2385 [Alkaliphilus metalliredigens QYMF]|uniref:Uncharacterized protein n=1 Tax=Alkaliphilus metalliredigens (strain QYMF) TaxID=293826 RepID=A6TQS1_ALKMQ|nr:hypothetical protein Amet_2385 [Alkaliphilus metalliredigens QYMF]
MFVDSILSIAENEVTIALASFSSILGLSLSVWLIIISRKIDSKVIKFQNMQNFNKNKNDLLNSLEECLFKLEVADDIKIELRNQINTNLEIFSNCSQILNSKDKKTIKKCKKLLSSTYNSSTIKKKLYYLLLQKEYDKYIVEALSNELTYFVARYKGDEQFNG